MSTDELWPSDAFGPFSTNRFGEARTRPSSRTTSCPPTSARRASARPRRARARRTAAARREPGGQHERVGLVPRAARGDERRALDGGEGGCLERHRARRRSRGRSRPRAARACSRRRSRGVSAARRAGSVTWACEVREGDRAGGGRGIAASPEREAKRASPSAYEAAAQARERGGIGREAGALAVGVLVRAARHDPGGRALEERDLGAARASSGTSCTALAPVPTTATRAPARSTAWSQRDEWNIGPGERLEPGDRRGCAGSVSRPQASTRADASITSASRPAGIADASGQPRHPTRRCSRRVSSDGGSMPSSSATRSR